MESPSALGTPTLIRVFGPLSVTVGDRVLGPKDLGGTKPRQIFELLVLNHRAVTKEELTESIWGRRTPVDPFATLETYVSVLRSALQPGVHRDDSLIATVPGGYRLVRDRAVIDVDRFDEITRSLSMIEEAERGAVLREAAALAQGRLLENEPYAEWIQSERRHYERQRLEVLVAAADSCVATGDGGAAIDLVERATGVDATCEAAYVVGMRAAGFMVRRDLVARLYQQCERSLRMELGITPMASTTMLRDELLHPERTLVGAGTNTASSRRPVSILG